VLGEPEGLRLRFGHGYDAELRGARAPVALPAVLPREQALGDVGSVLLLPGGRPGQYRDAAAVRRPGEGTHALLRGRDLHRVAAAGTQYVDLGGAVPAGQEREAAAVRRPGRRVIGSGVCGETALAGRPDQVQIRVVAVRLGVRAETGIDDTFAIAIARGSETGAARVFPVEQGFLGERRGRQREGGGQRERGGRQCRIHGLYLITSGILAADGKTLWRDLAQALARGGWSSM